MKRLLEDKNEDEEAEVAATDSASSSPNKKPRTEDTAPLVSDEEAEQYVQSMVQEGHNLLPELPLDGDEEGEAPAEFAQLTTAVPSPFSWM